MTYAYTSEPMATSGRDDAQIDEELMRHCCDAAARRLRWDYTISYRRRLRLPGVQPNKHAADQSACEELRHRIPIVLAAHISGIRLVEWLDPHPAVIDSTWTHPTGWTIHIHWDYRPDWTIGDATAITIFPELSAGPVKGVAEQ